MSSMYGNIRQHIPRTNFNFAAVYPSRLAMALDEKNYWNHYNHGGKIDYEEKNGARPLYNIRENDYVLVNYTVPKQQNSGEQGKLPEIIFQENQTDDLNNNNSFAFELNDDNSIKVDNNGNFIVKKGTDKNGNSLYNEYYEDLVNNGGTFAPGDYHMTVWQKQRLASGSNNKPTYVAIGRIHSILPTFETWGTYNIDILEPLSSYPDAFGQGKENNIIKP